MATPDLIPPSPYEGSTPRFAEAGSRCLACGLPITGGQQVFRLRDLVVHLSCAVYRRRRLRQSVPRQL